MKICVAQAKAVKGDIRSNIENHKKIIDFAISHGADIIIFPELSVTGYEPSLTRELALTLDDPSLNDFQHISDTCQVTIGIGVPLLAGNGVTISMVLFQPDKGREVYAKQYLHADEEPYFVSGRSTVRLLGEDGDIALAICYEISVPEHVEDVYKCGAGIYIASAVKSTGGIEKAMERLAEIGEQYEMTVLMANAVGESDGFECGGRSAIWDNTGALLSQLDAHNEGILVFDTLTRNVYAAHL